MLLIINDIFMYHILYYIILYYYYIIIIIIINKRYIVNTGKEISYTDIQTYRVIFKIFWGNIFPGDKFGKSLYNFFYIGLTHLLLAFGQSLSLLGSLTCLLRFTLFGLDVIRSKIFLCC